MPLIWRSATSLLSIYHQFDRPARQRRQVELADRVGLLKPDSAGRGIHLGPLEVPLQTDGDVFKGFASRIHDDSAHVLIGDRQAEIIEAERPSGFQRDVGAGCVRVTACLDLGVVGCAGDQVVEGVRAVVLDLVEGSDRQRRTTARSDRDRSRCGTGGRSDRRSVCRRRRERGPRATKAAGAEPRSRGRWLRPMRHPGSRRSRPASGSRR